MQSSKFKIEELIRILLENRGLKTKKEINEFLNSKLEDITVDSVGIDKKQLQKAVGRIQKAIEGKEKIIVYGDYDVDGICGAAILWESLHNLGANAMPYIPHRTEEGYGLSIKGIENLKIQYPDVRLIITVDNGIVANTPADFANKNNIDVIITDHHVPSEKLPKAFAIVHTTKLCGAGVAWMLSRVILNSFQDLKKMPKQVRHDISENHLELVALATIADLVPLIGANRTLTKFGLEKLRQTKRIGLLELFQEATLDPLDIDTYKVGHMIAPRLNAMGRIEHAMDSLRLVCTKDPHRARTLAFKLASTNRERQTLTEETVLHARTAANGKDPEASKLLFIAHESYQAGVIGLVAGRLVEEFYLPTIVISKGEMYSKASARSVHGFNIIEFIRGASEHLLEAGGHPMAAGFTVETAKLTILQKVLEEGIATKLDNELLVRSLRVDVELPLSFIDQELYQAIATLAPFGMGNPEPTFVALGVVMEDMRLVGNGKKHMKLRLEQDKKSLDAIAFGVGDRASEFHIGDSIDVVYTIDENLWNGKKSLQLKIKDMRKS